MPRAWRACVATGGALLLAAYLYQPVGTDGPTRLSYGRAWAWTPHCEDAAGELSDRAVGDHPGACLPPHVRTDIPLLLVEWTLACLLTGAGVLITRR